MELTLKTLTPIWTGGIDGTCDRIHETGIIGSLRWWYEALVRSLGETACDPSKSDCKDTNRCTVCELFGCTGWSRKFRLEMDGHFVREGRKKTKYTCKHPRAGHRGWFIHNGLRSDCFTLKITYIRPVTEREKALLKTVLKIVIEKAGIGARTQLGFGIIDYYKTEEQQKLEGYLSPTFGADSGNGLPTLHEMFFARLPAQKPSEIAELIDIKCKLREEFRTSYKLTEYSLKKLRLRKDKLKKLQRLKNLEYSKQGDFINAVEETIGKTPQDQRELILRWADQKYTMYTLRHFILGTTQKIAYGRDFQEEKMASKVFLSRPIVTPNNGRRPYVRAWGWVPERVLHPSLTRANVVEKLRDVMNPSQFIDLHENEDASAIFSEY